MVLQIGRFGKIQWVAHTKNRGGAIRPGDHGVMRVADCFGR